jgi:hypothetical protein
VLPLVVSNAHSLVYNSKDSSNCPVTGSSAAIGTPTQVRFPAIVRAVSKTFANGSPNHMVQVIEGNSGSKVDYQSVDDGFQDHTQYSLYFSRSLKAISV